MINCRVFIALIILSLGIGSSGPVFSQTESIDEITVTARKIGESIQKVPLSITAFTAEQIKQQQLTSIEDVAKFTPGLHMSNRLGSRNSPPLRFRGLEPPSEERNKQLASAFVDGIYLPTTSQWVSMNDVERVEVVKGPQSAFFGRATFGGAINFITKTPGNEWGGDASLIVGDNNRQDLWLSAEGPIIEDKLAVRASTRLYTYDGAWENPFPGSTSNLGAEETKSLSLTLYATPTDNIAIKFRHVYNEDRDGLSTQFLIKGESNNCGPFDPAVPRAADYFCGTLSRDLVSNGVGIDTSDLVDKSLKSELGLERFVNLTSLGIDIDIGEYTLSSVTGMYTENFAEMRELLTDEIFFFGDWEDESFSQELRLASPQDRRLRWMVGAYMLDIEYFKDGQTAFPCPGTGPFCAGDQRGGIGLFGLTDQVVQKVENRALFGSLSYDINDQFTVSLELRREEETLENEQSLFQEAPPTDPNDPVGTRQPQGGAEIPLKADFTATLPRLILDYSFDDNTTLYASYSEGNNPGGFNPEVIQMEPSAQAAFTAITGIGPNVQQAELKSYELGAKHTLANGRGYVNAGVYFMDWNNQRFRGFITNIDSNGDGVFIQGSDQWGGQVDYDANGSTDILGFELAASYAMTDNWRASASYNYNKSDIKTYEDAVLFRVVGTRDASGREVGRSPQHAGTFSLDFNMPSSAWTGDGEWFARWDAWYQSETYTWVINLAETEAAMLHNIRGGWRNGRYSVMAWIENATDDDSVLSSTRTTGSFLTGRLGYSLSLPEPRTYGVTFSAGFGGE